MLIENPCFSNPSQTFLLLRGGCGEEVGGQVGQDVS